MCVPVRACNSDRLFTFGCSFPGSAHEEKKKNLAELVVSLCVCVAN